MVSELAGRNEKRAYRRVFACFLAGNEGYERSVSALTVCYPTFQMLFFMVLF
jgi:hypothetical protein